MDPRERNRELARMALSQLLRSRAFWWSVLAFGVLYLFLTVPWAFYLVVLTPVAAITFYYALRIMANTPVWGDTDLLTYHETRRLRREVERLRRELRRLR